MVVCVLVTECYNFVDQCHINISCDQENGLVCF